jgi:DNA-binding transcriptional MerR regulator
MTLHEFLEKTGLADRTLRKYHEEGLVPQTGRDGRYGELQYLRVMAIPLLRGQGIRGSLALRSALDAMTIEALRDLVDGESESETPASEMGARVDEVGARGDETAAAVSPALARTTQTGASFTETHVHIKLRDGIVLDVRMPLDEEGQAIVQKIASMFGLNASFG